jgi:RHS repeat-associated protein
MYYLKDQVGNVRVILLRGTTAGTPPLAFQNYYPFGMSHPGGLTGSFTQRFGYQGEYAEQDPETKLAAFEARMYDAVTGRWLAVDPQHQFHSPYVAMGNNPVMMVDPDGEVAWFVAPLVFAAVNVAVDMAISNGNMSIEQIVLSAAMGAIAGATMGATAATPFSHVLFSASVGQLNRFMPGFTIPVADGLSVSASIGVGFGTYGFGAGFNVSGNVKTPDYSLSLGYGGGIGGTGSYSALGGSLGKGDFNIGYYSTSYSGANSQVVGGISLAYKDVSFRIENDYFGDRHDRWRSNAFELSVGNFVVGSNLLNNDVGDNPEIDYEGRNLLGKCNRAKKHEDLGAYKDGQTYSSPLWFGFKKNNQVYRLGYSHKLVQDRTQNVIHKWFGPGRTHFFNKYNNFNQGLYGYSGYYNPYSLW